MPSKMRRQGLHRSRVRLNLSLAMHSMANLIDSLSNAHGKRPQTLTEFT
jgi:hypothetical protein